MNLSKELTLFCALFAFATFHCTSAHANSNTCTSRLNQQTADKAYVYMKKNGLILQDEEQSFPDLGVDIRWSLVNVIEKNNNCLVIMRVCSFTGSDKSCDDGSVEVLGLELGVNINKDKIVPFEKVHSVPKTLVAKIGTQYGNDLSYYYAKLTGKSAVAASKSFESKTPYGGFSGIAVLGAKATFDPTPNRNWQVQDAKYDLRRGATAEGSVHVRVLDVQAFQLDGLDGEGAEGYWKGCQQPNDQYGKCIVSPWAQAFIRDLIEQ